MFSEERMYSKLKAFAQAEGLDETYRALPYMRSCHQGQTREPARGLGRSVPYVVHPLTMACHAHAIGIRDDTVLAVALLTKDAGRFLAVGRKVALEEYYGGISGNQAAMLVKCLDRCSNLSTMASSFSRERMARYITETEAYVLPMLEEIKRRYLDWNDAAFLLKYQILALLETQKALLSGQ